jgi:hypothetical protein
VCNFGRKILESSNYKLLSLRLLQPESFVHPMHTLEAKKAVLQSLSPMLKESEEQRKKDTAACEGFTRCRSTKGKGGSFSLYEYTDLDTQLKVDYDEFEKRFFFKIILPFSTLPPPHTIF